MLRKVVLEDAEDLFRLRTNPEVTRYLYREDDKDIEAVHQLIGKIDELFWQGDGLLWGISLKNSSELIGVVCFWRIDKRNHRAELGYMLHPEFWKKGIMTESIEAALSYGFGKLKLHSVEANTSVANLASHALLLKCGFVKEAHIRENWYFNGAFHDSLIFSKLADKK